jgi:uncharacterized protein
MQQQFERSLEVPGAPELVWEAITDVNRVTSWVSIVGSAQEVEHLSRYKAVLADRLGPFKLRADLDIDVREAEAGRLLRAYATGEDRQVRSRISVELELSLSPRDRGTLVDMRGQYEVTGRPATLGASSIRKKANKILDEFFSNAENELASLANRQQ